MPVQGKVSVPVIKRLPKYYRYLSEMKQKGLTKVSSSELARMMGTTASQVRQDFNCFGGFGQQGIGYNVVGLLYELGHLLFREEPLDAILIGTGRLGTAISSYLTNDARGYRLVAAFDIRPDQVGRQLFGVCIQHVSNLRAFCQQHHPQVAVLCVPKSSAKDLAPTLVDMGIRGFWNFSHYDLSVAYPNVVVENVHLGDSLMSLSYQVNHLG